MRALLIGLLIACLSGCVSTATHLGLSQTEWQKLNVNKRQALIAQYHQIHHSLVDKTQKTTYEGPTISVWLANGQAMMPPFTQPYAFFSSQFDMQPGSCQKIQLTSTDTKHRVNLSACYNGLTLSLDPSHIDPQKKLGSLRFDYNPIWQRGLTYNNVSSSGYVRLSHANITIKAIANTNNPKQKINIIKQKPTHPVVPQDDQSAHI